MMGCRVGGGQWQDVELRREAGVGGGGSYQVVWVSLRSGVPLHGRAVS